ncbi:MAG: AAA family ATPase [Dehalococcoidia bacterium]|nr:AAA family ATPase [Dehalococcoidia bacterium]
MGRKEELRRLSEALGLAAEGQGGVILLTGQPGIGKTRLAREALALARQRNYTALEGRAHPLEIGRAYGPIVDALGPLLRRLEPSHLSGLMDGLPDLGRLFGGLRLAPPVLPTEGLGDPGLEKTRLFESVLTLVERLTREMPVALFVDDLQWADPASFELLHHLARGLCSHRALLLLTYKDDALDSSRRLRTLIESLERDGLAEEILVPRLGPDGVREMVRGILGGEPPDDLLSLLQVRSSGTPLFVEALITALIDQGHLVRSPSPSQAGKDGWDLVTKGVIDLPPSTRRLILSQVQRLSPGDRRVLEMIAVMGETTSYTVLRAASRIGEDALLESLRSLRDRGLVAEGIDGLDVSYSIVHPLVQEVAYSELPEAVRRRIHVLAIEAIEFLSDGRPDYVSRLAYHYRGAGTEAKSDRAVAALVAAGERALAIFANDEAAQHYAMALAIVRSGHRTLVAGQGSETPIHDTLPWILERLGEAWERTGAGAAAIGLWNEALVLLSEGRERAGDLMAATRLRCHLARAECIRDHLDTANAQSTAGLAAIAGLEPTEYLADLHYMRFFVFDRLGDVAAMTETAAELGAVAGRLSSPRAEANANLVVAIVSLEQGDAIAARGSSLHALSVAARAQELSTCCYAHGILVNIGMRLGDLQFMRYHSEHGLAMAQRLGIPSVEIILRSRLSYVDFMSGAWTDSLRNSAEAIALARRLGDSRDLAFALAGRAMTLTMQGEFSEAANCLSEASMACGAGLPVDRYILGLVQLAEATLALEREQFERALGIAKGFAPSASAGPGIVGLMPQYLPLGLTLLAEALVVAEQPKSALDITRIIRGLGPPDSEYLMALASRSEGLAQQALGEKGSAIASLGQSAELFTRLEMPFAAAKSLLALAFTARHGTADERELAAASAQRSLATFDRLAAQRYVQRARQLLRGLGVSVIGTHQLRLGGVPVSEREIEIARLVTEGLTTRAIARRLVLSPRTVDNHLDRLYTRLGINSRTALARFVIEAGPVWLE